MSRRDVPSQGGSGRSVPIVPSTGGLHRAGRFVCRTGGFRQVVRLEWTRRGFRRSLRIVAVGTLLATGGCAGDGPDLEEGTTVDVRVPPGSTARSVGEHLERVGLIDHPVWFSVYVRVKGAERDLKAGHYRLTAGSSWGELLGTLRRGEVVTHPLTIPEGWSLREIAPRIAEFTETSPEAVLELATDTAVTEALGVPGPTLEGYLFPETYRFSEGLEPLEVLREMVDRYRQFWGEAERRAADSLGLSEREVVTLASIVEEEARVPEERPIIAGVYFNRLELGWLLQADPTVQYALGEPKERLLYRDIEAVADDPYNTYTQPGLPPGPIASPGESSLRAVLQPADVPYMFFVARPDGSHVFTRTEREHINAKNRIRREGR